MATAMLLGTIFSSSRSLALPTLKGSFCALRLDLVRQCSLIPATQAPMYGYVLFAMRRLVHQTVCACNASKGR
ncbi:hypothetical protein DAEQUDRAFT_726070 [Daedalea quercina L-15889]|uniref:Secreted protein n=1 Tax=Daedalea quercina L-15889 TaxID=1314783 RepID=A0A165QPX4_9APHY|nr:hypothetical protein DAEQUDRAFT_726070 [Daedalea quercina L-15889]